MPRKYRLDKLEMPDLVAVAPAVRKVVFRQGLKVIAEWLRAHVPDSGVKHKGKLNKSIRYNVKPDALTAVVKATAPHAHLIHEGVRGHWITRHAPDGHVYNWAWHPGLRPNPFFVRAGVETADQVEGVMRKGLADAITALAEGTTP
jgi:hypothetical protein